MLAEPRSPSGTGLSSIQDFRQHGARAIVIRRKSQLSGETPESDCPPAGAALENCQVSLRRRFHGRMIDYPLPKAGRLRKLPLLIFDQG